MFVTNEWLTLARLLFCLLASAGLHLGLAVMQWPQQAISVQAARQPLAVTLVSAAAVVQDETGVPDLQPARLSVRHEPVARQITPPPPKAIPKAQVAAESSSSPQKLVEPPRAFEPKEVLLATETLSSCRSQSAETVLSTSDSSEETMVEGVRGETISVSESMTSLNLIARLDYQATPTGLVGAAPSDQGGALTEARPMYSSNRLPEYPHLARQRHWEGVVWLKATVSSEGRVSALEIDTSSGHNVLDQAARRAVWSWVFQPARRGEVPVAAKVRVPVRFELRDS
jgi:protein TonB